MGLLIMAEDEIVGESENWRGSKTNSFREIIMSQVKRITIISSQEFRSGWWKMAAPVPGLNKEVELQYYPDTMESYSNAVEILHDLLAPKFEKGMKEKVKPINRNLFLSRLKYEKGEYKKDQFRYRRRLYSRKLFQEICNFLEKLGWLEDLSLEE